jgi:hypothetical protein
LFPWLLLLVLYMLRLTVCFEAECHGSEVIMQNAGSVTVQQQSWSSEIHPYLDDIILQCPLTYHC